MRRVENVCFINTFNVYVGLSSPTSSAVPQTAPNTSLSHTTCLICTISLFDEATPPLPPYQNDENCIVI